MQAGVCYWKDGVFWIGLLEDYPGYRTQGRTFQELKKNLTGLLRDLKSGEVPCVRRRAIPAHSFG